MKCPSCGFEQAEGRLDCEACGLIFAKWKQRHSPPPEAGSSEADPPPAPNPADSPMAPSPASSLGEGETEARIPDIGPRDAFEGASRHRLYDHIAALDFQKTTAGQWIYFPWGFFGKGYRVENPGMKMEIEGFVAAFCCFHSPLVVILALAAALTSIYRSGNSLMGWALLGFYLCLAYLFLGWRTRQWTSRLSPSIHPMNQKYYYSQFYQVFSWRHFLDLEMLGLFLALTCMWLWLTDTWKVFLGESNLPYFLLGAAFSAAILVGFSYRHYFQKK